MDNTFIEELRSIVGREYLLYDKEALACYKYDSTPELESLPGVVLLPGTADEVSRIMRLCHGAGVNVTPRGSGTNLSGGSLSAGGVVVQTSRMNRIIEVDEDADTLPSFRRKDRAQQARQAEGRELPVSEIGGSP